MNKIISILVFMINLVLVLMCVCRQVLLVQTTPDTHPQLLHLLVVLPDLGFNLPLIPLLQLLQQSFLVIIGYYYENCKYLKGL